MNSSLFFCWHYIKKILVCCLFLKLGKVHVPFFLGVQTKHHWKPPEIDIRAPPEKISLDPPKTDQSNTVHLRKYLGCFRASLKGLFNIHIFLWCFFWIPGYVWIPKRRLSLDLWEPRSPGFAQPKALRNFGKALLFGSLAIFYPGMPRNATGMKSLAPQKSRPWDRCWWLFIYIYIIP